MTDIDVLLSASLKRLAPSGDAAGVADAIRSRVEAGDTGTPASTSGFGGGSPLSWLPWVGLVVVGAIAGGAVGASGVLTPPPAEPVLSIGTVSNTVTATGCPGGGGVVDLERGTRVLTVVRTDDSEYLGVRDPLNLGRTVWLPAGVIVVDEGQPAVTTLPVDGCPEPTLLAETPAPAPAPTPTPSATQGPVPPPPPPDTTAPTLGQQSVSPNPIHQTGYSPDRTTISVIANDNVGVTSVSASWPTVGPVPGNTVGLGQSGNSWSFQFGPYTTLGPDYDIPVTLTGYDAAGNQSSVVVVVNLRYLLI